MGCSVCKEIIDNGYAVTHQIGCMATSILLAASFDGPQPTPEMAAEFKARSEGLARAAAAIEAYVNPKEKGQGQMAGTDNPAGGGA